MTEEALKIMLSSEFLATAEYVLGRGYKGWNYHTTYAKDRNPPFARIGASPYAPLVNIHPDALDKINTREELAELLATEAAISKMKS